MSVVIGVSLTQSPSDHFLKLEEFGKEDLGHFAINVHLKHERDAQKTRVSYV